MTLWLKLRPRRLLICEEPFYMKTQAVLKHLANAFPSASSSINPDATTTILLMLP